HRPIPSPPARAAAARSSGGSAANAAPAAASDPPAPGPVRSRSRSSGSPCAHLLVVYVPLDRSLAGVLDEPDNVAERHPLGRGRARLVVDALATDRALEIVHAEVQRDLADLGRVHDPVRLDVPDV